jgi:hypothetical protein
MEQSKELSRVKERIRRLAEVKVERGAGEQEVYTAIAMIGKLLDTYNLEMSDVFLQEEQCVKMMFDTGSKHRNVAFIAASGIAEFCQVRHWQTRTRQSDFGINIGFFGFESDVQMALYLMGLIKTASETAIEEFKETSTYRYPLTSRRKLTFSFYNGMGARLRRRLSEAARQRLVQERKDAEFHREQMKDRMVGASDAAKVAAAKATTGTAMMVVSEKKSEKIDIELKKLIPKFYKVQNASRAYEQEAAAHGASAADKVNLSRPLTHERSAGQLQISYGE